MLTRRSNATLEEHKTETEDAGWQNNEAVGFCNPSKEMYWKRLENLRVVYLQKSQNYLNVLLFYKYNVQLVHYAVAEFGSTYNCIGSIMTTVLVHSECF